MAVRRVNDYLGVSSERVASTLESERREWCARRPKATAHHERATKTQLHGTPTYRVNNFPSPIPILVTQATGGELWDIDGHRYADFSLSGSAALFGHSHPKVTEALRARLATNLVTDWPSEDHVEVTEMMREKFGLPIWQFSLAASDANRFALRLARVATGRQKILIFNNSYHGAIDETHAILIGDEVGLSKGVSRNGFDVSETTEVVQFNDIDGVEHALAAREIAAVLMEPAGTTRTTILMPKPGFHSALREITRETGTILIFDETQTIAAGPGGFAREFGLEPDMITLGKWMAGGLPIGMYGMSNEVAAAVQHYTSGAMSSTLAGGNALIVRAARIFLNEVLTQDTYKIMFELAERYEKGIEAIIIKYGLPWHVIRLGARVAIGFDREAPSNNAQIFSEEEASARGSLNAAMWLFLANRGVLINFRHLTSLFSPMTTDADVKLHIEAIEGAVRAVT